MAEANPPTWDEVDAAYQAHKAAVQRYRDIVAKLTESKDPELLDLVEPAIATMAASKARFQDVFDRHQAQFGIER